MRPSSSIRRARRPRSTSRLWSTPRNRCLSRRATSATNSRSSRVAGPRQAALRTPMRTPASGSGRARRTPGPRSARRMLGAKGKDDFRGCRDWRIRADGCGDQVGPRRGRLPAAQFHQHADSRLDPRPRRVLADEIPSEVHTITTCECVGARTPRRPGSRQRATPATLHPASARVCSQAAKTASWIADTSGQQAKRGSN